MNSSYNYQFDLKIEKAIIIIFLGSPISINAYPIRPDWFSNHNYRSIFLGIKSAVKKDPNPFLLFTEVESKGYNGTLKAFESLKDQPITNESHLHDYVKLLHYNYLCRQFDHYLQQWHANTFDTDSINKLSDVVARINSLDIPIDTGSINQSLQYILDGLDTPRSTGIKSYPQLDNILGDGLYPGLLFTIGARTGIGKTAFALNLVKSIESHDSTIEVDYFSLEMTKNEILDRFISMITGINSLKLKDLYHLPDNQKNEVKEAVNQIRSTNLRIFDKIHSLNQIISILKRRVKKNPTNHYVAIVDYIGLIKVDKNYKDRYLQIGEITGSFKRLATEYSFPIIEITQLNRMANSQTKPKIRDIRESGNVEQDSNVVALLWHNKKVRNIPKRLRLIECSIEKNRSGMLADIDYLFDPNHMVFKELSPNSND